MRVLLTLTLLTLSACGSNKTIPTPAQVVYIHDDSVSLEQICYDLETYTVNVGDNKVENISQRKTRLEVQTLPINAVLKNDLMELVQTIYNLPIEDHRDAEAFGRLVYRNCILKHD